MSTVDVLESTSEAEAWVAGYVAWCDSTSCLYVATMVVEFGRDGHRQRRAGCTVHGASLMNLPAVAGSERVERVNV